MNGWFDGIECVLPILPAQPPSIAWKVLQWGSRLVLGSHPGRRTFPPTVAVLSSIPLLCKGSLCVDKCFFVCYFVTWWCDSCMTVLYYMSPFIAYLLSSTTSVTLLLEWQPKVVTIAHMALYQNTTSVVSLTDVFLFSESALVNTQWLTWSCQDAKGKRLRKTYVSLGNLYFIREGS